MRIPGLLALAALAALACSAPSHPGQPGEASHPSASPALAPAAQAMQPAAATAAAPESQPSTPAEVLAQLRAEADSVRPLVSSDVARAFLAAVKDLPTPGARTLWRNDATGRHAPDREIASLPEAARAGWKRRELGAESFYYTRYGSPLAYARALDVLAQAGLSDLHGLRVLDYGYGTIGHLRLLALCGADAHGVDVDSYLSALYDEPGDQGPVSPASAGAPGAPGTPGTPVALAGAPAKGPQGRVTLHDGRWPADDAVRTTIGAGYDLFLSKNTLKRGYVHPSRKADPRQLIDLGVDDATFLAQVHALLKPGGLALLYNICPPEAGPDQPWLPWSDGRSPFTREQWEAAGFEVLAIDTVDDAAARAQGVALGWGSPDEMERGICAWSTLARRKP